MSEIAEKILFTMQFEHVTFFIVESPELEEWCALYSESKKGGRLKLGECYSYEEALFHLEEEMDKLSAILDYKRKGRPTPNQLMFLFREKIPIPLELTWGDASDLISGRIAQIKRKKQNKSRLVIKEKQFCVGDRVQHTLFGAGIVLQSEMESNTEFVEVQFSGGKKRLSMDFARLEKVDIF